MQLNGSSQAVQQIRQAIEKIAPTASRVVVIASSLFLTNPFAYAGNPSAGVGGSDELRVLAQPYARDNLTSTILSVKNTLDWMIGSGVLKPQIDAGRLAPVATTGATRWAMLPSVPTVRESGLPEVANYAYALWLGVVTIAGVPSETITKLHEAIATALRAPDLRGTLERQGYEIVAGTPQEFAAQIRAELDQNRKLIEGGRIKLD